MSKFLGASEEENLELIGSWWERYKILIVVGILLIGSIILGREMWVNSSQNYRTN
jgi:predicted negative regulator of RcsB-dependent stress response